MMPKDTERSGVWVDKRGRRLDPVPVWMSFIMFNAFEWLWQKLPECVRLIF